MAQYRFVGAASAEIWDTNFRFDRFGQLAELPDDMAAKAVEGRIAIIPASEFDAIFNQDDVKKYTRFDSHVSPTMEFAEKREVAWKLARSQREKLSDKPAAPPQEEAVQ